MKEVLAILPPRRVQAAKAALAKSGIHGLHAVACQGHGRGQIEEGTLKAAFDGQEEAMAALDLHPPLVPMRSLTLMIPEAQVEPAVQAILHACQTGQAGDGKIFVCETLGAVRVRTGESGDGAL